jgi:hypothetical protein
MPPGCGLPDRYNGPDIPPKPDNPIEIECVITNVLNAEATEKTKLVGQKIIIKQENCMKRNKTAITVAVSFFAAGCFLCAGANREDNKTAATAYICATVLWIISGVTCFFIKTSHNQ